MTSPAPCGTLFGVGLGPGDPDLLTIKAVRTIGRVPVVAFFAKHGRRGHARCILDRWLPATCLELPLFYPVTTEIPVQHVAYGNALRRFYAEATEQLAAHLSAGRDVALACEGDPLFYGSFMHLYARLRDHFPVQLIPGVTGMAGCWNAAGEPMSWGDDILTVLPGTLPAEQLAAQLASTDAAVIMKIGKNFPKVRQAIAAAGLGDRAIYVERGTMEGEIVTPLLDKHDDHAPYFSIILIPGKGRRP